MNFTGTGKRLTPADLVAAAALIDVSVATIRGVVDVEASGRGFDAQNRPKILPEPHVFHKRLGPGAKRNKAVAAGVAYPRWGTKPYPDTSQKNYDRLATMMAIDEAVALESTSWGLAQIMGFNAKDAGYKSAKSLVEAFKSGEGEQLDAFMRLVDAWDLEDELQRRDAKGFASHYNGAAYAKNGYDRKLRTAWLAHDKDKPAKATADLPTDHRLPPAPVVSTADDADTFTDTATVMQVQRDLRTKGFYGVGPIDGELTDKGMTESAILNFRNKNDLPLTPTIDKDFLAALAAAPAIEVDDDRAAMSSAEVAAASPELAPVLNTSWYQKLGAAIAGFFGLICTFANGVVSKVSGAVDMLTPVKDFLGDVPVWAWGVLIVFVAGGVYLSSRHAGQSAKALYNKGVVT